MTTCGAVGALMVGGRVVGQVKCELDAGHDEPTRRLVHDYSGGVYLCRRCEASRLAAVHFDCEPLPAAPHAMTLTWTPEAEPDLDLFDPAESFDVDVPLD